MKVCGCRPHEGGAAHTGAGVRKPPMEETAGWARGWCGVGYGDLSAADEMGEWSRGALKQCTTGEAHLATAGIKKVNVLHFICETAPVTEITVSHFWGAVQHCHRNPGFSADC